MVRRGKKATHKCSTAVGGFSGPSKVQGPVSKPNSVNCHRQLNSGSLHKQTRWNPLGRDVRSPVENHDLVPSLLDNTKSQTHSRVSECDGRPSVQVIKQICLKWFTPHVDLFATRLNHKVPLYMSPVPDQNACDIDALNINWSGLTAYAYSYGSPSQGDPQSQAIKLPDHRNSPRLARDALVLGPSAALNRDPTSTSSVKNSSQTVPQLCVPQRPTASQLPRLVSKSGQLQEEGFSVEVAERITAPQRSSTRTIFKSKWALFEKWCRENLVDFSTPSVKQVSDYVPVPRSKQAPFDH